MRHFGKVFIVLAVMLGMLSLPSGEVDKRMAAGGARDKDKDTARIEAADQAAADRDAQDKEAAYIQAANQAEDEKEAADRETTK